MGIGDQSLPHWVSQAIRIFVGALGLALICYGTTHLGIIGFPFLIAGVMCLVFACFGALAEAISGLFLPTGNHGPPPAPQYAVARSLIAQHDYAGAEQELRRQRVRHPADVEGLRLLVEVLATHLQRGDEALQLARDELARATTWQADHERLVLLAADIALDLDRRAEACALLQQGLQLNPERAAATTLRDRLASLQA